MSNLSRRDVLKAAAAAAVAGHFPAATSQSVAVGSGSPDRGWVNLTSDGLHLTPAEQAARLHRLADRDGFTADDYSLGGVVAELETAFAALLGKEAAIFMPTGTLANHLAVRALAGSGRVRVLVPHTSHIYNDTGDGVTALSGLNMVPLGRDSATFTRTEVEAELGRSGRVAAPAAALVIESPVRRCNGERFDPEELLRVTALARAQGVGLHLDGARMLIAAACTGIAPAVMAAPFDTVYVSLYKGLNAPSGAILAGPRKLLDGMFQARRMFGGGLPQAWVFAAGALEDLPGFTDRLKTAFAASEQVFQALESLGVKVRRVPRGTNVAFLSLGSADPAGVQKALAAARVRSGLPSAERKELRVLVNESWSRRDSQDLARTLARALGRG